MERDSASVTAAFHGFRSAVRGRLRAGGRPVLVRSGHRISHDAGYRSARDSGRHSVLPSAQAGEVADHVGIPGPSAKEAAGSDRSVQRPIQEPTRAAGSHQKGQRTQASSCIHRTWRHHTNVPALGKPPREGGLPSGLASHRPDRSLNEGLRGTGTRCWHPPRRWSRPQRRGLDRLAPYRWGDHRGDVQRSWHVPAAKPRAAPRASAARSTGGAAHERLLCAQPRGGRPRR